MTEYGEFEKPDNYYLWDTSEATFRFSNGMYIFGEFYKDRASDCRMYDRYDCLLGEVNPDVRIWGVYDENNQICEIPNGILYYGESEEGGEYYEGWFNLDRQRHGRGKLIKKNFYVYEGEFENNKFSGEGSIIYQNGVSYEGHFKDDKFHGYGEYRFVDGRVYEGVFFNDCFSYRGVMRYPDGSWYEGFWNKDKKDGIGKFTDAKGNVYSQEWKKGYLKKETCIFKAKDSANENDNALERW